MSTATMESEARAIGVGDLVTVGDEFLRVVASDSSGFVGRNPETQQQRRVSWTAKGLQKVMSPLPGTEPAPGELVRVEASEALAPLSDKEREQLHRCEAVIEEGQATFLKVGRALATVRDGRLYREGHATFEDYCRERWAMGASRGRQLMASAEVYANIESVTTVTPGNEAQLRPLARLEPEQQQQAWQRAEELAGEGRVTAAHVEQAAAEIAPKPLAVGQAVWWREADEREGIERLRAGVVVAPDYAGRVLVRPEDGGYSGERALERAEVFPGEPPSPPNPYIKPPREEPATPPAAASAPPAAEVAAQPQAAEVPDTPLTRQLIWEAENAAAATEIEAAQEEPAVTAEASAEPDRTRPVPTAAEIAAQRAASKPGALKSAEEKVAEKAAGSAEPPKPAPVTFPLMPDMAERLKKAGLAVLPALRFGCALAEIAAQHGTEPQLALKDLEHALTACAAEGRPLAAVVRAGIEALDSADLDPEGQGDG